MKKVISFDIWDTIIKRKCHPEEIKLKTANYLLIKYNNDIKDEYKDIYKILKKRDNIEYEICMENSKKKFDEECKIEEVFDRLTTEIFKIKKNISDELLKYEIESEKAAIYLNPDILEIFEKYKDLDMYCVSDFYMGADSLKELLDYLKLPIKIKKIYSSADYLLNKKSGNLYKIFEKDLGIEPSEHIHCGDNIYSDIETAKSLGIQIIRMNKENIEFSPKRNRKHNFGLEKIKVKEDSLENKLYNAGLQLSPLLYFFVYNIIEDGIKNNVSDIYYQTREGETYIKIHKMIQKNNPFGFELPKEHIMEVSRMATFAASLKEFSISELLRLWSQYRSQSIRKLFKTLNISTDKYKKYFDKYDLEIKEDIIEPWFDIRIQNLCNDEEFKKQMDKELSQKRNQLIKFFEKNYNITNDDKPIFIVDIGWRGTIQDNLAYIFNNKQVGGYYMALFDYYNYQPKNTYKKSFISNKKVRDDIVVHLITLLEWIFNPGTGSVIEYNNGKSIRKAKTNELNVVKKYIEPLQRGMFAGAEVINEYMKNHPYEGDETKEIVYDLLSDIKVNPNEALIEAYYSMVFNDTFGSDEYIVKEHKLSFFEKLNIIKCRNILRKEDWKEAFITYNKMGYLMKLVNIKQEIRKILGRGKKKND